MNPDDRRAKGKLLLVMAEALTAGREAGHNDDFSDTDNPYDKRIQAAEHLAWKRGFWVGRSLNEQQPLTLHVTTADR